MLPSTISWVFRKKKKKKVRGGENIQLCGEKKNALLILGVRGVQPWRATLLGPLF